MTKDKVYFIEQWLENSEEVSQALGEEPCSQKDRKGMAWNVQK